MKYSGLKMSMTIFLKFLQCGRKFIIATKGICRRCIDIHKKDVNSRTDLKEELKEICSFVEHMEQGSDEMDTEATNLDSPNDQMENQSLHEDDTDEISTEITDHAISIDAEAVDMDEENMETSTTSMYSVRRYSEMVEASSVALGDINELQNTSFSQTTDPDLDFSSQTTVASSWSKDEKSHREIFNQGMDLISNGKYMPLKSQVSQPFQQLQYSSRMYYIRQARSALEFVCESIAPSQYLDLMTEVIQSLNSKDKHKKPKETCMLTDTVISAYKKADDHTTKIQILSIIVDKYSKLELMSLIDGLTIYKIDSARKYASTHGPGQYITPPKITRVRLSKQKIHHFIEFISSPCYLQVVGFGSKHLKLTSGLQVKVPKVIRTMIASRLITAYNNYCKENSINPPSRATLYKIVKACAASQLKSLRGLDNYTSDGMEGIDTMKKIVTNLGEKGLDGGKVSELQETLESLKTHLKNEFKGHLTQESGCLQHCIQFALSENECEHDHSTNCGSCDLMYNIENQLQDFVKDTKFSESQEKEEMEHDIRTSKGKVWAWRDHCIRTVNQDQCKKDMINTNKLEVFLEISALKNKKKQASQIMCS